MLGSGNSSCFCARAGHAVLGDQGQLLREVRGKRIIEQLCSTFWPCKTDYWCETSQQAGLGHGAQLHPLHTSHIGIGSVFPAPHPPAPAPARIVFHDSGSAPSSPLHLPIGSRGPDTAPGRLALPPASLWHQDWAMGPGTACTLGSGGPSSAKGLGFPMGLEQG